MWRPCEIVNISWYAVAADNFASHPNEMIKIILYHHPHDLKTLYPQTATISSPTDDVLSHIYDLITNVISYRRFHISYI